MNISENDGKSLPSSIGNGPLISICIILNRPEPPTICRNADDGRVRLGTTASLATQLLVIVCICAYYRYLLVMHVRTTYVYIVICDLHG